MRDYGEWTQHAACRDMDPDLFARPKDDYETQEAKRVCQLKCSVKSECLTHATIYQESGTWGGYSQTERRYIRPTIRLRIMAIALMEGQLDPELITDPAGVEMYKRLIIQLAAEGKLPHKIVSNTETYEGPMAA